MTRDGDDFWDALGDHLDPIQVPVLEALWRIGEPLSAICMVDVFDGYLSMWEAADHLEALQELDIVEPASGDKSSGDFDAPYRLKTRHDRNDFSQLNPHAHLASPTY